MMSTHYKWITCEELVKQRNIDPMEAANFVAEGWSDSDDKAYSEDPEAAVASWLEAWDMMVAEEEIDAKRQSFEDSRALTSF